MPDCTKSQTVLVRGYMDANDVEFRLPEAEHGIGIFITRFQYEDMGSPDTVTVTVEPGDKLNA